MKYHCACGFEWELPLSENRSIANVQQKCPCGQEGSIMEATIKEISAKFGIKESTVRTMVKRKLVKFRKSGAIILVSDESVKEFLKRK